MTRLLRRYWFLAILGLVIGCSAGTLINAPTCQGNGCTCDEDPTQPLCKGFNDRPEGGTELPDASEGGTTTDAEVDAPAGDAGDEAG